MRHLLISYCCFTFLLVAAIPAAVHAQAPASSPAERESAIKLYRQGDTKTAIKTFRIIVKKDKTDSEAWYYLGLALTREGQFKEAGKAYEAAIKLKPDFASAHTGLAYVLLLRNELPLAKTEGERAIAIDPNLPDAHYVVGVVHLRNVEAQQALEEGDAAIKIDRTYARGYLLRSQALVSLAESEEFKGTDESYKKSLADYRDAVASLENYLKLNGNSPTDAGWREQLEALKSSVQLIQETGKTVFRSKEVTERARVIAKPEPTYTETARQHGVVGTVVLRAVFANDGRVKHLSVVRGLPDGLTEQALASARKIKFVPAKKDGHPVSMWMQLEYNFNLY